MKNKTVYTESVIERMVEMYTAAQSDEARDEVVVTIATELNVKVESVRAKLVSLKVYVKKERLSKTGKVPETKGKIVADIANLLGVDEESIDTLEKPNKSVLEKLREALQ